MMNAEELIEYFVTLRRGYDRAEFTERVKQLGALVEATPLSPNDFSTLFRIWLDLEIPISGWSSMGACVVPATEVPDELVRLAARWLLAGLNSSVSASRLGFLLNWLTAALDHNLVNAKVMDECYTIFYTIFQYERHAPFAAKLLYTLTKPHDVTRHWTQHLFKLQKTRDSARDRAQIAALLNLYKSYKPECVPENVAAVSVHNAFPKINATLLCRFKRVQNYRNAVDTSCTLKWHNNLRAMGLLERGNRVRPLVPDMEFISIGSQLYSNVDKKNLLHFNDSVSVLAHSLRHRMMRPAQLLSMLCNETGAVLLCMMPRDQHAFFSHDLKHQLDACFLHEDRLHSYEEKADLLYRLARFQQVLQQAVPVVSHFLASYLPLWDGCRHFEQILALLEWVELESARELRSCLLEPLERLYLTVPALTRHVLLKTLTTMYSNMAYFRTRTQTFFQNATPTHDQGETLAELAQFTQELCLSSLRTYPGNSTVLASVLYTYEALGLAELTYAAPVCSVLPPSAVAQALASRSAHALNCLCRVLLLEGKVYAKLNRKIGTETLRTQANLLTKYRTDLTNCLWMGKALTNRDDGIILTELPERSVDDLFGKFPNADEGFSLRKHLALAPYTYVRFDELKSSDVSNEFWLKHAVEPHFKDIARLIDVIHKGRASS